MSFILICVPLERDTKNFTMRVQKEKVNIIRGKVPEITDFAESPEEKGKTNHTV